MTPDEPRAAARGPSRPGKGGDRWISRRAVLRAGWTVPVIVASVELPTPAMAASAPPPPPGGPPGGGPPPGAVPTPAPPQPQQLPPQPDQLPPGAAPTGPPSITDVSGEQPTAPSRNVPSAGSGVLADTGLNAQRAAELATGLLATGGAAIRLGRERQRSAREDDGE